MRTVFVLAKQCLARNTVEGRGNPGNGVYESFRGGELSIADEWEGRQAGEFERLRCSCVRFGWNISTPRHPGGNPGANLKSISHRCHPILVVFVWKLIKETMDLPLGCLQAGV
jgi:hypothetical protein